MVLKAAIVMSTLYSSGSLESGQVHWRVAFGLFCLSKSVIV
jgi:hypothetical protein